MIPLRFLVAAGTAFLLFATGPVRAQLLSEEVRDNNRVCTYFGNDTLPDGQVVPKTFSVGSGQNCPATAPYRDPNTPVPANAMLTSEQSTVTNRICVYEQGGVQYQISVDLTLRCAMTPALLQQARDVGADASD